MDGEEAAGEADSSFTAMPTFAPSVGLEELEGEDEGENLRYIDEEQLRTELQEESEEEGDEPDWDIPYEPIAEEQQPELEEVSEDTSAAVNMAVDAAIKAVASDPSLTLEGSTTTAVVAGGRGNSGQQPGVEKPETVETETVKARTAAGEPRLIGSPPAYRAPVLESQRAADVKGGLDLFMDSMHLCCDVPLLDSWARDTGRMECVEHDLKDLWHASNIETQIENRGGITLHLRLRVLLVLAAHHTSIGVCFRFPLNGRASPGF